jgi:hypothetical protein
LLPGPLGTLRFHPAFAHQDKEQTMREFDPNDPLQRTELREVREESNMATIGVVAALVLAFMVGIFLWNTGDRPNTAMNAAPGVTTGSSPATPAPPAPPAKDSDTTR